MARQKSVSEMLIQTSPPNGHMFVILRPVLVYFCQSNHGRVPKSGSFVWSSFSLYDIVYMNILKVIKVVTD